MSEGRLHPMTIEIDGVFLTLSAGVNDARGSLSQTALQDGNRDRRFHGDDVTRRTVDGDPVQSEREQQWSGNALNPLTLPSYGRNL